MQIDPKALLARWFENFWNQGREEIIELMAPNAVAVGPGKWIRRSRALRV